MRTVTTAIAAVLSASLIACGGGTEDSPMYGALEHCPKMFQAAWIVGPDESETLLTTPDQSELDDDSLAAIGFFQATVHGLQGDVYVGGWCQDE